MTNELESHPGDYSWLDADAVEGSYVPALDTLPSHKESLREDVLAGFMDIRVVLLWQHALSAATLGQADSGWPSTVYSNRVKLAAMLSAADHRTQVTPHPPSDENARRERLRVVQHHLMPAFNEAAAILRGRAGDYADEGAVDDVDRQEFVAMRPRLHQRAVDQHAVLRWALGLTAKPLATDEDLLLGVWLLTLLADEVLPVMNESLADAAERSNEKTQTPPMETEVPQG
jgi:hypothetical protein